jgi:predicted RNase H-like HicB family nuclease
MHTRRAGQLVAPPLNCGVRRLFSFGVQCPSGVAALRKGITVKLNIESEREDDGRWLAEVPELPGVLAYGASRDEALAKAQVLALRVLAERIENNEGRPEPISISIAA